MAIRQLRFTGDPVLRKRSREVENINERISVLMEDMLDTMYENNGVGLAAPQVGILRRVIVVDVGDGPIKLINPEIIEQEGENLGDEGCLSVPNQFGKVMRPYKVKVEYLDEEGRKQRVEAEDFFARALCHEIDHLNGVLFTDKVEELETLED